MAVKVAPINNPERKFDNRARWGSGDHHPYCPPL